MGATLRHLALCVAALAFSCPASAQPCPALQVRNPSGNYIVPGAKGDIPYSGDLALDAYVPPGSSRAAVGRRHSRRRVDLRQPGRACRTDPRTVTHAGYNWFSVDYRLGGLTRFEDSLADMRAALGLHSLPRDGVGHRSRSFGAARRGLGCAAGRDARRRTPGRRHRRGARRRILRPQRDIRR